jgi:hypothetical protein
MGEDDIFIEANANNAKSLRDAADEIDAVVARQDTHGRGASRFGLS